MSRNLNTIEFREQALIKVRERGTRSVQDVANDLHMAVGTLRKWLSKSKQEKGEVSELAAQLPDDLPAQSWGAAQYGYWGQVTQPQFPGALGLNRLQYLLF